MENNLDDKNFKDNMTEWVKLELQMQSLNGVMILIINI